MRNTLDKRCREN